MRAGNVPYATDTDGTQVSVIRGGAPDLESDEIGGDLTVTNSRDVTIENCAAVYETVTPVAPAVNNAGRHQVYRPSHTVSRSNDP